MRLPQAFLLVGGRNRSAESRRLAAGYSCERAFSRCYPGLVEPLLITADWGTSTLRVYLLDLAGRIVDRRACASGIGAPSSDSDGGFARVLEREIDRWQAPQKRLPVLASGMIGSRNGWIEAPYVRAPAALADLARALVAPAAGVWIVPGIDCKTASGYDVMRGEETQILGALALGAPADGLYVLPGTHSKWVSVRAARVECFTTYLTGELFAVLKAHSILGRLMAGSESSAAAFRRGVEAARTTESAGALLARLFSVRTLALALALEGELPSEALADYLSGLLIGCELLEGLRSDPRTPILLGEAALVERYARALECLGHEARELPADQVVAGQLAIARAAGIVA